MISNPLNHLSNCSNDIHFNYFKKTIEQPNLKKKTTNPTSLGGNEGQATWDDPQAHSEK